jgi:hypothetical protein
MTAAIVFLTGAALGALAVVGWALTGPETVALLALESDTEPTRFPESVVFYTPN